MTDTRPGIYNINLIQNEHFDVTLVMENQLTGDPYDITGSEVFLQVKENRAFPPIFSLSIGNGLTITADNRLRIFMADALTRRLHGPRYQYDILFKMETGTKPKYLVRGQINVTNTISRSE